MISITERAPLELNLHGFSNTTEPEFRAQLISGKRYVVYQYAMSFVLYGFMHHTRIHMASSRKHAILKGLPWTLVSFLLGWWSLPGGPIFTVQCLINNLRGGLDVSGNILDHIRSQDPRFQYGMR